MKKILLALILIMGTNSYAYDLTQNSLKVLHECGISAPKNLTPSKMNTLIKKLALTGKYKKVRLYTSKAEVYIDAFHSSQKMNFYISGNEVLSNAEILKSLAIEKGQKVHNFSIEKKLQELEKDYQAKGVKIPKFEIHEDTHLNRLTLHINEGKSGTVKSITFLSDNKSLNKYLRASTTKFLNKEISRDYTNSLKKLINDQLILKRYLGAKIGNISQIQTKNPSEIQLTVSIANPIKYEFIFYGNKFFSHGNFLNIIDLPGNYLNFIKNNKLLNKHIANLYNSYGFINATVSHERSYIKKLKKIIFAFQINEGKQVKIKRINVSGKISRNPGYYEGKIREFLSDNKNSYYYIKNNLHNSATSLISYLKNQGYLKASLININHRYVAKDYVAIDIRIDEGILTQIRSINFSGLSNFTPNQLFDIIKLQPNSPLNLNTLIKSFDNLVKFYKKNGFLDFKILTKKDELISYVNNYEFADINFNLHEGPKVYIKTLGVKGNSKTKSKVLIRELNIEPGDLLTSEKITDSVIFLERTQLFSKASIETNYQGSETSERDVFVEVQEKKPGLFTLGLGLSNENNQLTYRGYFGLSYKNLGGTGRGISARADINYASRFDYLENRIVIGYYEPYLYFNRLRFRSSLIHEEDILDPSADPLRILENNQLNLSLEKQITRRLKFTWKLYELSVIKTFNKDDLGDRTSLHIASLGPILEYDKRDHLFAPKSGSYSTAQAEYSAPFLGSTSNSSNYIHYFKASLGHTVYSPLTRNKKWVFVNTFKSGFLSNLSSLDRSGVPATESFFFGTRDTIRGYNLANGERIPRLEEICNGCLLERFRVAGNSHYFLYKSEIRFPLYDSISGLFFYDAGSVHINRGRQVNDDGSVQNTFINIDDHYRDSAGFGFRYETPIGALALELGFKLDRKPEITGVREAEDPFNVHVSMVVF